MVWVRDNWRLDWNCCYRVFDGKLELQLENSSNN